MLYFSDVSDVLLQSIFKLNDDEKLRYKYYNKRITTRDNGKVQSHESHYGECIRHLNVRIGEHIGISPLTRKQVKPKNSSVADHLLLCNYSASYDDFSIVTRDNSKFLLELKESLLILRDKPSLNRNITSAPLYLFNKA